MREQRDGAQEIIELIMSAHYDIAACQCWICVKARTLAFHNRGMLPRDHPLWRALAGSVGNYADVFAPSFKGSGLSD